MSLNYDSASVLLESILGRGWLSPDLEARIRLAADVRWEFGGPRSRPDMSAVGDGELWHMYVDGRYVGMATAVVVALRPHRAVLAERFSPPTGRLWRRLLDGVS